MSIRSWLLLPWWAAVALFWSMVFKIIHTYSTVTNTQPLFQNPKTSCGYNNWLYKRGR